ncbi:hypothetical protein PVAG01_05981 [Phlyctema vagabunda]|uniref:Uncharacterized protein n=1 Tax=Phlyctema vagabunda TaxID=108571 RepID=A0ABR4PES2_9HELO
MEVGLCQQAKVPQTPVTPVTVEAIMSLHDLIKQDTYTLDETSMPRLQRHIQKLAKAGQTSIAYRALLEERNSLLTSINDEAKTSRLTKSVVLGKGQGKVMSFEDIEEARRKRAEKDATKGKGKRGRKRKSTVVEADEPDTEAEVEPEAAPAAKEVTIGKRKRGRKCRSALQDAGEPEPAPEPGPAPESEPEPELEVAQTLEAVSHCIIGANRKDEAWNVRGSILNRDQLDFIAEAQLRAGCLEAISAEAEPEPEVARPTKEVIKGRGKRGRKRKIATQEAEEPEPEVAHMF